MIESIKFENFKALRDTTLPLSQFTLIVGPNGSGKSTALKAMAAFANPSDFQLNRIRTITIQRGIAVKLTGIWSEPNNRCKFQATWSESGFTYPQFEEIGTSHAHQFSRPQRAISGVRLYSLAPDM